ncbi:DUF4349 domain-containing protein [Halorussus sp. MSC15.2]|uniref:DUF4349 domain-containing protein n=1 Tax=Halorussus sp. MSC15.2 TaxID=2283638 RepID=UPI0013D09A42|nr:DUF4349 domain-containing protein [Halorussus sp. MSC15.2]NEU59017.1 DUF4349 domain-containing protein [Halorussus sp. MSC15.2]
MARDTRRWLVPVALALLLVLAGCSGSGSDASRQATAAAGDPSLSNDEAATQASSGTSNPGFQGQDAQVRQRALIRTGTVSVEVEDYDDVRRNLTRTTRRLGGFVGDSSEKVHTRGNRSWTTGKLVVRVPKENFSALVTRAKRTGEVRKASTNTKDVTEKLVDIDARLKNLEAQREKLRSLYEEANDTENVLEVQQRLSEVQSEIERLQAQRKSLKRQVAYSTLTVRLNERPPEPESPDEDRDAWYDTGLVSAFLASADGVVVVVRGLAVGLAYAMPYLLAFGVPVGGVVALWRRRRSADTASAGANLPDAPEPPDATDASETPDEDD